MYRKVLVVVVCIAVLFAKPVSGVESATVQIDNDGTSMSNPYGKSNIPPSFKGEYYDCYIPYNLSIIDIGGYSRSMAQLDRDLKISGKFNWEDDFSLPYTQSFSENYAGEYTRGYCEETGVTTYMDKNGTVFYMCAIPFFMYANNIAGSSGFPGWGMENRGQVYDLILTDGTVLHFIVGDAKSKSHTNGNNDGSSPYIINDLKLEQYRHLFQSEAGETFELFGKSGCVVKFMEKYNIGSADGKNRVAYVRMYNLRMRDGIVERQDGIPAGVGYSLGDVNVSKGNLGNSDIVPEYMLTGMPSTSKLFEGSNTVHSANRDDLSVKENYTLQVTKNSVDSRNRVKVYDTARYAMAFIGLLLCSYASILLLSFMFDSVNSFIDISMVSLVTFGSIKVCSKEEAKQREGYSSYTKLYISIGVMFALSILLVSGAVLPWVMKSILWVVNGIKSLF